MIKNPSRENDILETLVHDYGELILESWSTHPIPILHHTFAEIVACLELLNYPVNSGVYEARVTESTNATTHSLPRFGIASLNASDFRKILNNLRKTSDQAHRYTSIADDFFKENEEITTGLDALIKDFNLHHSSPAYARLITIPGEYGEIYISFTGGLLWQQLDKKLQVKWIKTFDAELEIFLVFLKNYIKQTKSQTFIDKKLRKLYEHREKLTY